MRPPTVAVLSVVLLFAGAGACAGATPGQAGTDGGAEATGLADSGTSGTDEGATPTDASDADGDGGDGNNGGSDADAGSGCFVSSVGVSGQCVTTSACAALGNHTSTPGYCAGPSDIQCCTVTPNIADNPPVPAGWKLMPQSAVTPDMTAWAVAILHDPTTYPMFSTAMRTFGSLMVMARVEWHPPDFQNSAVHRGVTLYEQG